MVGSSHQNQKFHAYSPCLFIKTKVTNNSRGDEELDTLIRATIAGGGVIPHIHKSLIGKKEQSQKSS